MSGDTTNLVVSYQGHSIPFTTSGSSYTPLYQDGSSLSSDRTTFTDSDGTVIQFRSPGYAYQGMMGTLGVGSKITYPDGTVWDFYYNTLVVPIYEYWCDPYYGCVYWQVGEYDFIRLSSLNSSTGYQIKLTYSSDFWNVTSAKAINNAVEYCDPNAASCSTSNSWPTATYTTASAGQYSYVTDPVSSNTSESPT